MKDLVTCAAAESARGIEAIAHELFSVMGLRCSEHRPRLANEGRTSLCRDNYNSHDAVTLSKQSSRTKLATLIRGGLTIAPVLETPHGDSSVFQSYNAVSIWSSRMSTTDALRTA